MEDVILIPGLGKNHNERIFLWLRPLWRLYGIKLHVCEINWEDDEKFAPKYQKLKNLAQQCNNLIGIVGASAGASAMVNLLAGETKLVKRGVSVCGLFEPSYLNREIMQHRSPAFLESLDMAAGELRGNLDLAAKILTIRPRADRVVDPKVATVMGAHDLRVASRGHAISIAYVLTFKVRVIRRFFISVA